MPTRSNGVHGLHTPSGLSRFISRYVEVYLRMAGTDQDALVAGMLVDADERGLLLTDHTGEYDSSQAGIWIPMDNVAFVSMRPTPPQEQDDEDE